MQRETTKGIITLKTIYLENTTLYNTRATLGSRTRQQPNTHKRLVHIKGNKSSKTTHVCQSKLQQQEIPSATTSCPNSSHTLQQQSKTAIENWAWPSASATKCCTRNTKHIHKQAIPSTAKQHTTNNTGDIRGETPERRTQCYKFWEK